MTWLEAISAAKDISLGVAGAVTATVAVIGLRGWQRELKGTAEFEVARKFIQSTYKIRDHVRACRTPLVSSNEFPPGYSSSDLALTHKDNAEAWAHVFKNRWKPLIDSVQEFDAASLEAEALWGRDIRTSADALRTCLVKLRSAADAFVDDKVSGGEDFKHDRNFGIEIRKTVFSPASDENNPLTAEINSAVKSIEEKLKKHLNRQ